MTYFKLREDGTLEISGVNGDGFEPFDTLPRHDTLAPDECKYYNKETITGVESNWSIEIDYDAIQAAADDIALEVANTAKYKALDKLIITHETVAYDANGKAVGNMSAVMGVANFKFNQLLAQDVLAADAYQWIYKDTKIFWKGADDKPHEVMIESVCEALELSMNGISKILGLT